MKIRWLVDIGVISLYQLWAVANDRRAHTRNSFTQSIYQACAYYLVLTSFIFPPSTHTGGIEHICGFNHTLLTSTVNMIEMIMEHIYWKLSECYIQHMKPILEKGCELPWTKYFTNEGTSKTDCSLNKLLYFKRTSEDHSQRLVYHKESPCKGKHKTPSAYFTVAPFNMCI